MYALLAVGDMGSRFGVFGTLDLGEVFQVLPEGGHCGLVRHELGSGSPGVQQRSDGVNPGTSSHQGVTHIVAELQQLFLGERSEGQASPLGVRGNAVPRWAASTISF